MKESKSPLSSHALTWGSYRSSSLVTMEADSDTFPMRHKCSAHWPYQIYVSIAQSYHASHRLLGTLFDVCQKTWGSLLTPCPPQDPDCDSSSPTTFWTFHTSSVVDIFLAWYKLIKMKPHQFFFFQSKQTLSKHCCFHLAALGFIASSGGAVTKDHTAHKVYPQIGQVSYYCKDAKIPKLSSTSGKTCPFSPFFQGKKELWCENIAVHTLCNCLVCIYKYCFFKKNRYWHQRKNVRFNICTHTDISLFRARRLKNRRTQLAQKGSWPFSIYPGGVFNGTYLADVGDAVSESANRLCKSESFFAKRLLYCLLELPFLGPHIL